MQNHGTGVGGKEEDSSATGAFSSNKTGVYSLNDRTLVRKPKPSPKFPVILRQKHGDPDQKNPHLEVNSSQEALSLGLVSDYGANVDLSPEASSFNLDRGQKIAPRHRSPTPGVEAFSYAGPEEANPAPALSEAFNFASAGYRKKTLSMRDSDFSEGEDLEAKSIV